MIYSMTGYGSAKNCINGLKISVELKSVNNRYLDCSVRLPRGFLFAEEMVKANVQQHISRGKVDVYVAVEYTADDAVNVEVNKTLASSYVEALRFIADEYGLNKDISAVAVGKMPDVLTVEKKDADTDAASDAICSVLESALFEFDSMRCREGEKLKDDIISRLETIEGYVSFIEARSPVTVTEYRKRLYTKMSEVLQNSAIDEQRILLEASIFADKIAVDEETVRLRSHISQMHLMLDSGSPIGRKMDFLIQEFNRESNTIGSKCNDSQITKTVIELKSEIEKIREQIQNIE